MTEATSTLDPVAPPSDPDSRAPHLGWAVAGLSAAAGVIHIAMVPSHAGGSLVDPVGFAVVGWFQLLVAGAILADRAGRTLYKVAILGNLVVLGLWLWSRTAGLPFGEHAGVAEEWGSVDGITAALEVGVVLLSARMLMAPEPRRVASGKLAPALLAVGALGLATVAITSTDAADHGHSHDMPAAAAPVDAHVALMAQIDADRCDRDFNIPAYWEEAKYLGVDTYQGGAMSTHDASASTAAAPTTASDGHAHSHGATSAAPAASTTTTTTEPDPTEGRGSEELDDLIALTSLSSGGEVAAADLVTELSQASDDDYDTWLWWLKSTGQLTHAHGSGEDGGGHGGHVGPQPWVAMTDPEQCARLAEELDIARETALSYPTAADAEEAGWHKVTPYLPGIAAHYINGSLIDGKFEVDKPEMLLYDGNELDANIVGLSYYIWQDGEIAPTSGFTGDNDHGHRHQGLCTGPGGVIGDSTTTPEECAARGGFKANGSKGWMSHAWVVPGCESAWGVFSAASPLLDSQLQESSGTDGGSCAGSGVRARYGLPAIPEAQPTSSRGGG